MEGGLWCPRFYTSDNRTNDYSSVLLFFLQGQELLDLPRMDLVRYPGLPRHSHAGIQKSALCSFLLRLLRDRRRRRSTCTGCPPYLPMTSGVNGYRSQPTGRGCACPVGVTVQDPAPPVMQDVGTLYLGIVPSVRVVPLYSVIVCVMYSVEQYPGMVRGYIKPLTPSCVGRLPGTTSFSPAEP